MNPMMPLQKIMSKKEEISIAKNWRLWVSYSGAYFSGFQSQPGCNSVELSIKKAFRNLTGFLPDLTVAGRTDAGVHAVGQVVSCTLTCNLNALKLQQGLNHFLRPNIVVWRLDEMPFLFNARKQSIGKRYVYSISQSLNYKFPFNHFRTWNILNKQKLNIDFMRSAASFLIGEHDFESFRSGNCTSKHARRYIWKIDLIESLTGDLKIDIRGNAFCHNMVRIIVGTLVDVGLGHISFHSVKNILSNKNRKLAGKTAPASGLTLQEIYYPDNLNNACIPHDVSFPGYPIAKGFWPC